MWLVLLVIVAPALFIAGAAELFRGGRAAKSPGPYLLIVCGGLGVLLLLFVGWLVYTGNVMPHD